MTHEPLRDTQDLEQAWRDAYSAWWRAAREKRWSDEAELRNVMEMAWWYVPQDVKRGAWGRYVAASGWPDL